MYLIVAIWINIFDLKSIHARNSRFLHRDSVKNLMLKILQIWIKKCEEATIIIFLLKTDYHRSYCPGQYYAAKNVSLYFRNSFAEHYVRAAERMIIIIFHVRFRIQEKGDIWVPPFVVIAERACSCLFWKRIRSWIWIVKKRLVSRIGCTRI